MDFSLNALMSMNLTRIEYKYFVYKKNRPYILNDLLQFMHFDRHKNLLDHSYKVASIYFEDHGLTSYQEKLEGQPYRKKIRVRFYPQSNFTGANLEIKYKKIEQGFKIRINLSESVMKNLLNGSVNESLKTIEDPVLRRVIVELKTNGLKPFVKIDYNRIAFYSKTDTNVRVTLDSNVKCSRFLKHRMARTHIPVIPSEMEILEIKSDHYFPYFLCYLIKKYSLKKSAISKYVYAVQNLGLNSSMSIV
jgi:SPX domain protein involved in polyphosphate accumulation